LRRHLGAGRRSRERCGVGADLGRKDNKVMPDFIRGIGDSVAAVVQHSPSITNRCHRITNPPYEVRHHFVVLPSQVRPHTKASRQCPRLRYVWPHRSRLLRPAPRCRRNQRYHHTPEPCCQPASVSNEKPQVVPQFAKLKRVARHVRHEKASHGPLEASH
jgi:hypothetical protein